MRQLTVVKYLGVDAEGSRAAGTDHLLDVLSFPLCCWTEECATQRLLAKYLAVFTCYIVLFAFVMELRIDPLPCNLDPEQNSFFVCIWEMGASADITGLVALTDLVLGLLLWADILS